MADREVLQHPGDFLLDGVLIVGSSGVEVEVTELLKELNIYQSLDSPFMSGNVMIEDGSGLSEVLPFIGQERIIFSLRTPGRQKIDFNRYHGIIYNVGKRFHTTDRAQTLLLNFTSLENYKDVRTKISQSFKGTISSIVQEILKSENYLGTKKPINIDITKNIRTFVSPNITPFKAIDFLKVEAVSAAEQSPHYLFYENPDGFHFRSLDSLLGQLGSLSVEHKETYRFEPPPSPAVSGGGQGGGRPHPETALPTILHWEAEDNSNSFIGLRKGMYASTLYTHDIFNKNIQKFEFDYVKDRGKRNTTNQRKRTSSTQIPQTKIDKEKTITEFSDAAVFVHPSGSDKMHTLGTDNNAEEWLQESRSRALERQFFTLKIETYGNTGVMVGDIIKVVIPSNKTLSSAEGKDSVDPILSGRYLVTEQHHLVLPDNQMHSMVMTIMKDSFEQKPKAEDRKYQPEPQGKSDIGLSSRTLVH